MNSKPLSKNTKTSIVSKDWLRDRLKKPDYPHVIGRALVAIFKRQTDEERSGNFTKDRNNIGFSSAHGRIGALGAKHYLKHKTLLDWQMRPWLQVINGYPRLCKYARQLNDIAHENTNRLRVQ